MRVLIDQDEVSIFRTKMLIYVNEIVEEIEKIQLLKNELIWQGKSFDKYIDIYERTIIDIKSRIEELTRYIDFLNNFNKKYNMAQNNIKLYYQKSKGNSV